MSRLDVVGIGAATLDVLVRGDSGTAQATSRTFRDLRLDGGGCAGTAMVAAARLGLSAGFIGTAGSDELAAFKLHSLREAGVDTSRLVIREGKETQVTICHIDGLTGDREFSLHSGFCDQPLDPSDLDKAYITGSRCLLLDGRHLDAALQAAIWTKNAGGIVVLDGQSGEGADPSRLAELIALTDILIGDASFAIELTKKSSAEDACRAVLAMGPHTVVRTDGAHGCLTVTDREIYRTAAFRIDVVDTTGAGDVFHGAYIVGLLNGWDGRDTATFACAAAGLSCTQMGGRRGIPTTAQTLALIATRQRPFTEPNV